MDTSYAGILVGSLGDGRAGARASSGGHLATHEHSDQKPSKRHYGFWWWNLADARPNRSNVSRSIERVPVDPFGQTGIGGGLTRARANVIIKCVIKRGPIVLCEGFRTFTEIMGSIKFSRT